MTNEEAIEHLKKNYLTMLDNKEFYKEKHIESIGIAIKALEKQIPKKPINGHPRDYRCPYCYNDVYGDGFYCGICGQALDWGDDDDK